MIDLIDLHTHSTASDGSYSPRELITLALKRGISILALTDHDTIMGLEEAENAAKEAGIGFIPGIELEISGENAVTGEFHLLGLGITKPGPDFTNALADLYQRRKERNLEILERMKEMNITANYNEIVAFSGGHSVGRPHFASYLVKNRIARNTEQAFDRYLGKGKPLYVPKEGLELEQALSIIKGAGGIAVLAHPMSLYVSWGKLPDLIKSLADRGLQGIEAWHPTAKVQECKRLAELGKSLRLIVSAGSDFHGELRRDRKLGITSGSKKIDLSLLEAMPDFTELCY